MQIYKYLCPAFLILLFSLISETKAQKRTIKYNIKVVGLNVGQLTATENIIGIDTLIQTTSNVQVKLLFNYRIKILQQSSFRSGELLQSSLYTYKNDELNSSTELIKSDTNYKLIKDNETSYVNNRIDYSGSLVFFYEPQNVQFFYFEINGKRNTVKQVDEHTYVIINPETGREHRYEYENGILKRSSIEHMMATIYTERVYD